MPNNLSQHILFVTEHENELSSFFTTIERLNCDISIYSLEQLFDRQLSFNLILCNYNLFSNNNHRSKVEQLIINVEKAFIPFLFFSLATHSIPSLSKYPIICLQNSTLFLDYIRIKLIEKQQFDSKDDFTKTLLKKDVERENAQRKLDAIRIQLKELPDKLNEKAIFLTRKGNILTVSKGFKSLPIANEEPLRYKLLAGLHPDDFKKIKNTLAEFTSHRKDSSSFWIRHKMGTIGYHYFKVNMSNFFDSGDLNFALITIEGNTSSKETPTAKTKNFLNEFIENFTTKGLNNEQIATNKPLQSFLSLFPKIMDVRRLIIILQKSRNHDHFSIREWCNDSKLSLSKENIQKAKKHVSSLLFSTLEEFKFEEVSIKDLQINSKSSSNLINFCEHMNVESFISIPIGGEKINRAHILFDIKSSLHKEKKDEFGSYSNEDITQRRLDFNVDSTFDFLNFLPIPISIKDEQHRWLAANDSMLNFLGKDRFEVLGKTDYELFMEDEANVFWETDELVLEEKINFQNEEYIYAANGHQRIVVTNKSLFQTLNGEQLIVSTMKDVTKLKEIEKDLRERTEKLRKSERKLKSLNSTKDRFFSIIAHDLKNPFNTLVGFTSILSEDLDQFDKNEIDEFIKIISDAAQHGYKLLENLLDWARTQTGKFQFEPVTINVCFLIDECISLLRSQAERKNIMLHSDQNEPIYAFADANMIELVIRNLLSNAIKFTNFGGQVMVEIKDIEEHVEISVIDNGIGIQPSDIEKLFRIDVEFSNTGTDAETGTGLGLILCKEFVEKNGGTIYAESTYKKGSRFSFTIPKNQISFR